MDNRGQFPPELSQAAIEWAEASARLAATLREIDWDQMPPEVPRPRLTLVQCQSRSRSHAKPAAWRTVLGKIRAALFRIEAWELYIFQLVILHPGVVSP